MKIFLINKDKDRVNTMETNTSRWVWVVMGSTCAILLVVAMEFT